MHSLAARRRHLHLQDQWHRALAEGAESPERLSVRADMQALAQACAAVTAPVLPTPPSVAKAKRSQEWPQWKLAIGAAMQSFFDHGVWKEGGRALPAGNTALQSHIVLDRKRDGRYKARLVAGGIHQEPGVNFNETFAPACSYRTLRMIAEVAARHEMRLRQFDIKIVFLNGVLEEEVYVRPPAAFEYLAGGPGRVLRLRLFDIRRYIAKHISHDPLERSLQIRQAHERFCPDVYLAIRDGERCLMLVFLNNGKSPEAPCKIQCGKYLQPFIDCNNSRTFGNA